MSVIPRTLFLTGYINQGGTSRVTLELIRFLKERENPVALAVASEGPHAVGRREPFPIFEYAFPKRLLDVARAQRVFNTILKTTWYKGILRGFDPQMVYVVDLSASVINLAGHSRRPCIAHIHAIHLNTMTKGFRYLRQVQSFADHYITSSRAMADNLEYCLGIPSTRITVLFNGIPLQKVRRLAGTGAASRATLGLREDEFVVMGSGAVGFAKGTDHFLRVAAAARKGVGSNLPWRFVWVGEKNEGSNPQWDGCRRLMAELGVEDRVTFVGYQENAPSFFSIADVFLLTSRAESVPLAMMEAMALGKPVVAFPVGGVGEVLSAGGGLVAKSSDPVEAGQILGQLLEDSSYREGLGAEAAEVIRRRFDSEELFGNYEDFLCRFLERRRVEGLRDRHGDSIDSAKRLDPAE